MMRYWCAKNVDGDFYSQTLNYYRAEAVKAFDDMWRPGYGKSLRRKGEVKIVRVTIQEAPKVLGVRA